MSNKEFFTLFKNDVMYLLSFEPFYANILTDLNRSFTNKVPYAGVSIKDNNYILHINPEKYFPLPIDQRMFILIHELLHIIFEHLFDATGKNFKIWNYATDICINQMIQNNIASAPPFVLNIHSFKDKGISLVPNLSSTEYYEILINNLPEDMQNQSSAEGDSSSEEGGSDSTSSSNGNSNKNNPNPSDKSSETNSFSDDAIDHSIWSDSDETTVSSEMLKQKTKDLVKNAALAAGDSTPSIFRDFLVSEETSETPWFMILRRISANKTSSSIKRTWKKPHRYLKDNAMGKKKTKKHSIYVIVDTSASIKEQFLTDFYNELNNLLSLNTEIIVIECDMDVQNIYKYKKNTTLTFKGGGGTNFVPAFHSILEKEDPLLRNKPNLVICLTDGYGLVPDDFKYKTVFCLTENGKIPYSSSEREISWGNHIFMK